MEVDDPAEGAEEVAFVIILLPIRYCAVDGGVGASGDQELCGTKQVIGCGGFFNAPAKSELLVRVDRNKIRKDANRPKKSHDDSAYDKDIPDSIQYRISPGHATRSP